MGGAVLVSLLLLLALMIGPQDETPLPDEEGSESPGAYVALQPAEPGMAAVAHENLPEPERVAAAEWVDRDSAPASSSSSSAPAAATRQTAPLAGNEVKADAEPQAPEPQAPAADVGPQWGVQVGSFAERGNAVRLSDWCREQGYGVKILLPTQGSGTLYRVRVGPFVTRDRARAAVAQLALQGRNAFVTDWDESAP